MLYAFPTPWATFETPSTVNIVLSNRSFLQEGHYFTDSSPNILGSVQDVRRAKSVGINANVQQAG